MRRIWSTEEQVRNERALWVCVMKAQTALGLNIDREVVGKYEIGAVQGEINLERIEERERRTRHDLKARLEEFNFVAGCKGEDEKAHLGMTSADVVENVTLMRMQRTLKHLDLEWDWLPFRGIKGAIGTFQDQLDLLGSWEACQQLDEWVSQWAGFGKVIGSIGQVMPRSIDLQWGQTLFTGIVDRAPEHAERHAAHTLCRGYGQMIGEYCGDQWNEGDVSSSVVRRVALPNLAYLADWMLCNHTC